MPGKGVFPVRIIEVDSRVAGAVHVCVTSSRDSGRLVEIEDVHIFGACTEDLVSPATINASLLVKQHSLKL